MRLTIVNYHHFAKRGAHSYRWLQLAAFIQRTLPGSAVDVVCKTQSSEHSAPLPDSGSLAVGVPGAVKPKAPGRQALILRLRQLYRLVFWPDGLWHWLPSALWQLYRVRRADRDYVVSYSPTFSAHLAVLLARKLFSFKGRWIADYGDPFSLSDSMPPNNFRLWRGLNHWAELAVLKNADSVVFTNQATLHAYERAFGRHGNFKVIPHMVDVGVFNQADSAGRGPGSIDLTYVGGFHPGIREPAPASIMMTALTPILAAMGVRASLQLYGPANGCDLRGVPESVVWHGPVDRYRAISLLSNAQVLLNIENQNCVMAPSKIVEYIATGLPIINLAFTSQPSVPALGRYIEAGHGLHLTPGYDPLKVAEQLLALAARPRLQPAQLRTFLSAHMIDEVAAQYFGPSGVITHEARSV